ncbi:MAG: Wzz/FepE/Etk N-terminal domain-containing protein [Chloroflexota bacterium]
MELKYYLRILLRRWPVIVILPVVVASFAAIELVTRTPEYSATARLSVVRSPDAQIPTEYQYDEYYNYLASEFAIDDLVEIVQGSVYAEAVAQRVSEGGLPVSGGEVRAALTASREHRVITMNVASSDDRLAVAIATAAVDELRENAIAYLSNQDEPMPIIARAIDVPTGAAPDTERVQLIFVLAVVVSAGFGVLLALLIDLLDDRFFDEESAEYAMGCPHLASIPVESR